MARMKRRTTAVVVVDVEAEIARAILLFLSIALRPRIVDYNVQWTPSSPRNRLI